MRKMAVFHVELVWWCGVALLLGSAPVVLAGDGAWSVRTWQMEDGSNNLVTSVNQSPEGYLWISTSMGVNRFDGVQFTNYNLVDLLHLPSHSVRMMLPTRDGSLWLAMDNLLVKLNAHFPPLVIRENVPPLRADSMVEAGDGTLWIAYHAGSGYHSGIVCRIDKLGITALGRESGIPDGGTTSLAVDSSGELWLAKPDHVGVLRDGRFIEKFKTSGTTYIAPCTAGGIWVCADLSVQRYYQGRLAQVAVLPLRHTQPGPTQPGPTTLLEDHNGALWIGTGAAGLFRYGESHLVDIGKPQVKIVCLEEDRDGNIWAGTDAGLDRICPRAIEVETAQVGLPLGSFTSICEAKDGNIWAAMADGSLHVRSDGQWRIAPFSIGGDAHCVTADPAGAIWIGTRNQHLYRWQFGQLTMWDSAAGVRSHMITALMAARNGDLWIGGIVPYSVQCLRAGRLINFKLPSTAKGPNAIVQDQQDNIWVGAAGSGKTTLMRIRDDKLIDESALISQRPVQALCTSPDNTLWIGFRMGGVGRIENGRFNLITANHGIDQDHISQIVPDGRGWFWFGSRSGIFKIREQDLNDIADGKLARVEPVRYGDDEGLPRLQAQSEVFPSAMRSRDGQIWMATATALSIIHPERIHPQLAAPLTCIEGLLADGRIVASEVNYFGDGGIPIGAGLSLFRLEPDYHHLEFDFTALTFNSPESTRFRYKLDGFDEDWNEASSPRKAIYPRLPAGNYHFQVMACNADGIWNPQGAQIALIVPPFIWQTWWFQALALLMFAAILLLLVRYLSFRRLRRRLQLAEQRHALDRERARIARDIHDDLGHDLTQIVLLSEMTMQDNGADPELNDQLHRICSTAQQGIRSLDETVWAINSRNDTLADLIDYIVCFAVESLQTADIKCDLDLPAHPPELVVPSEMRHAVFLIVKEAINNILRHAQATMTRLRISIEDDAVAIMIADDGRGFSRDRREFGQDGLRNMEQRMIDIGGEFSLDSAPGKGTRILLAFPWKRVSGSAASFIPTIREV